MDIRLSIPLITRRLYLGKRALGINVFPGIDMLPDERIES